MHYLSSSLISFGLLVSTTLPTLAQQGPALPTRQPVSAARAALHQQHRRTLPGVAARPTNVTVPGTTINYS